MRPGMERLDKHWDVRLLAARSGLTQVFSWAALRSLKRTIDIDQIVVLAFASTDSCYMVAEAAVLAVALPKSDRWSPSQ